MPEQKSVVEQYEESLHECPFCGKKPHFTTVARQDIELELVAIECHTCSLLMTGGDVTYKDLNNCAPKLRELMLKWNLRNI